MLNNKQTKYDNSQLKSWRPFLINFKAIQHSADNIEREVYTHSK